MIHTDAIEETEEPSKKLKVEVVDETEVETPKNERKVEFVEVEPEKHHQPETKEVVEEPKVPEEGLYFIWFSRTLTVSKSQFFLIV